VALRIEEYALIGDCETAALVGRDGSIDWLCMPRFDSGACFAALLGEPRHGRWLICPKDEKVQVTRRYRPGTLVLDTDFHTPSGTVRVTDFMPLRRDTTEVVRIVKGLTGRVPMRLELIIRFDYGSIVPWVRRQENDLLAIAGPDMLRIRAPVELRGENLTTVADFEVAQDQELAFTMDWHPSNQPPPKPAHALNAVDAVEKWWLEWSGRCQSNGPYREPMLRSLITLKALTYAPTGGIVAAPTTSLPEWPGGPRNWDYRYCWVRDATFTLMALVGAGYLDEAQAWREWLLRAVAGSPAELQIMYGIAGERRLTELELGWLPGYENSSPVRIGNAASRQFQLDVYGELVDAGFQALRAGLPADPNAWNLLTTILQFLETAWHEPDDGIWEVRGGRRHFTHSKIMAWVAMDRGVKVIERLEREGPIERWRQCRDKIHREVCERGFDSDLNSFVQSYGSRHLDASLLMIPLVGFLPADDERVRGTVAAIEKNLLHDGLVQRYQTETQVDGLPPGEGVFLPCTFWLADNYHLLGRMDEARELLDRLLHLRNDVGLLSEEYDPVARRLLGNFPQAFSHIALVNTARALSDGVSHAEERSA
jgi:GH15 family glucan-1,4-alpha-glucosidase